MRKPPASAVSRRNVSRAIARTCHAALTHGEPRETAERRRLLWNDHVAALAADGVPNQTLLWEVFRSAISHIRHRTSYGAPTFLPAGFGLLLAALVGVAVSLQGAAPQRPEVYLHLSVALFTMGGVFIARPVTASPKGMRVGAALLATALVHLSVGYEVRNTVDLVFYPATVAMFVGCGVVLLWSYGVQQQRLANLAYLLFSVGLVGLVALIVGRSFTSASSIFGYTFLVAGFAAALVANFLLRCRTWLTNRP